MTDDAQSAMTAIDTTVPHSARIWNYWLGGQEQLRRRPRGRRRVCQGLSGIIDVARAQRAFLSRSIAWLAGPAGMRQFLDVGTGLPTADNTHQIAQRVAPDARIVYVDNDRLCWPTRGPC